jgi:hypothetical protein
MCREGLHESNKFLAFSNREQVRTLLVAHNYVGKGIASEETKDVVAPRKHKETGTQNI